MSPDAVPENISPDCQDVAFAPGEVGSRPAVEIIFDPALETNATIVYGKSFKTPTGAIKNLHYSSTGNFYVEDVLNTPGTATLLFSSTPGSYCKSITAFGREYIAISDGLHGSEVPLQYDGTLLRRVTSDGPGAPATVTNLAYPPVALVASGSPTTVAVVSSTPTLHNPFYGYWQGMTVVFATAPGYTIGESITFAGSSTPGCNGTYPVFSIINPTTISFSYFQFNGTAGAGGTSSVGASTGTTLTRLNNIVFGSTVAAHNLQIGYQALIAGVTASQVGGGIASVVINNEDLPGIATITTNTPHGLAPQENVFLDAIPPNIFAISAFSYANGVVDITISSTAGLQVGSSILSQIGSGGLLGPGIVLAILSSTTFTTTTGAPSAGSGSGGQVQILFPLANAYGSPTTPVQLNADTFQVVSAPTPTTFQVAITYTDGTWTGGTVSFAWDGTFYVTAIPSPTQFQYQQYGPNSTANTAGTLTPFGQAAPGLHLMQVLWLTDQGAIPAPSPFVTIIVNGGQYLSISDIPIGPSYVKGRILAFTGAQPNVPGTLPPFFYIPATPQVEGQIVGTATQINDNTTTSVILDFSDNTLFAALGISIPGNTLANQIVLDGALGFGAYSSRLLTLGQRNRINNLLNMGFGGGALPSDPTVPAGWTQVTTGGTFVSGRFGGQAWNIDTSVSSGKLQQSMFEDYAGAPIATGSTLYKIRYHITVTSPGAFVVQIFSPSTSFVSTATIPFSASGWYEATFGAPTPTAIPADLVYSIEGASGAFAVSEGSVIYVQTPYTDSLAYGAYANNPEGIDGVTGQFGPNDDPAKIMDFGILRETLYLLTQSPSGRLHETTGSGVTEPSGWVVDEVAADCGVLSAFGLTHSQADDTTASGGDNWMAWPTEGGAMIFGGGLPEKISQELQPNWYDPTKSNTAIQINMAAATSVWGINDPVQRLLMFGLPIGAATAPNKIYVLNYRNLNSSAAIANSPPFHPSFAGKLIATDNSRKWAPWNLPMNGAARMYRAAGALTLCLLGGNSLAPSASGVCNVYTLNPAKFTDDTYGLIVPYYFTYFFLDPEKAQALQLKGLRIMLAFLKAYVQGTGQVTFSYYPDSLTNLWPLNTVRPLTPVFFDREAGGGQCTGDRIAIKIGSSPITGTDNGFVITRLTAFIKDAKMLVRGAAR